MPLFSPKKLLIFQNKNFLSQERKTTVFVYAFMFSSLILASFTIHKGLTLEKVYSVQLRFFLQWDLSQGIYMTLMFEIRFNEKSQSILIL